MPGASPAERKLFGMPTADREQRRLRVVPRRRGLDGVAPVLAADNGHQHGAHDRAVHPAARVAGFVQSPLVQIAAQPAAADNGVAQAPPQVACVIRSIGTFGVPGDTAKTALLEVRTTRCARPGRRRLQRSLALRLEPRCAVPASRPGAHARRAVRRSEVAISPDRRKSGLSSRPATSSSKSAT